MKLYLLKSGPYCLNPQAVAYVQREGERVTINLISGEKLRGFPGSSTYDAVITLVETLESVAIELALKED